jgi:hypothetical protein
VWLLEFIDNRYTKVVELAALGNGRLHPPPPSSRYPWYSFLLRGCFEPTAIVQPEGLSQWRIPMTALTIEHATFRLVAQCLNKLRRRVTPHADFGNNIELWGTPENWWTDYWPCLKFFSRNCRYRGTDDFLKFILSMWMAFIYVSPQRIVTLG